ncbi:MAG: hypothetical protein DHS20C11_15250 [Lysobacteraceae bacterium]|nr:MAG: hypothetical protein DHS20C11_15250 [Xanthomonadaceae bacterium]
MMALQDEVFRSETGGELIAAGRASRQAALPSGRLLATGLRCFNAVIEASMLVTSVLWVKSFHIIFVVSWFAALFYLPRLYVYHVEALAEGDERGHQRFLVMESRLLKLGNVAMILALVFGGWLLVLMWPLASQPWFWLKAVLVVVLIGFHHSLGKFNQAFANKAVNKTSKWFRFYNEVPALVLIAIVLLVVVKPYWGL